MVNVPDGRVLRLYVDDEPFEIDRAQLRHFERVLDLREGVARREVLWETPSGKQVHQRSKMARSTSLFPNARELQWYGHM